MKAFSLSPFIKPGIATFILMLTGYLGIWTTNVLLLPEFDVSMTSLRDTQWPISYHIASLLILVAVNSVLLRRFVLHFSIIRIKSFLPVLFYLTFTVIWRGMRTDILPHIFLTLFLLSLEFLFGMYRNRKAVEASFLGSIFISVVSLFNPLFILMIPVLWMGMIITNALSLRVWLASLTGIVTPWIFYNSWFWFQGTETEMATSLVDKTIFATGIPQLHWTLLIYAAVMAAMGIIVLIGLYSRLLEDSIQTRKYIHVLVFTTFYTLILAAIYVNSAHLFLPLIAFLVSVLLAHPLSIRRSVIYSVIFIVFFILNVGFLTIQYLKILQ
jgi:hypothetical protein